MPLGILPEHDAQSCRACFFQNIMPKDLSTKKYLLYLAPCLLQAGIVYKQGNTVLEHKFWDGRQSV